MSEAPAKYKIKRNNLKVQLQRQVDINYALQWEIRKMEKKMLRNNFWMRLFKFKKLD